MIDRNFVVCKVCGTYYTANMARCPKCKTTHTGETTDTGPINRVYMGILLVIAIFLIALYHHPLFQEIIHVSHYRVANHPKIGQKVSFAQPIVYIVRETPSIVPIVEEIGREIERLHPKRDDETVNGYIPVKTVFTVVDVYYYKNAFNPPAYYYILSDGGELYILSEDSLEYLQKPVNEGVSAYNT